MSASARTLGVPALISGLILALTLLAALELESANRSHLETSLKADATLLAGRLQMSLDACTRTLGNVQKFYEGTPGAASGSLRTYTNGIFGNSGCAGASSLSYAPVILPEQRDVFLQSQQSTNSGFSIRPSGSRPIYAPVVFSTASVAALAIPTGTDLFVEPAQQAILTSSRDSGNTALSGKFLVSGADNLKTLGFALATPLFQPGAGHADLGERRANLAGWALLTVSAADWLAAALGDTPPDLQISVLTDRTESDDTRLVATPGAATDASQPLRLPLHLDGQEWHVTVRPTAAYLNAHRIGRPGLIGGCGLLLALLAGGLFFNLQKRQETARSKFQTMETALQESDERWRFALEGGDDGIWSWDVGARQVEYSPRCDAILGVPARGAATARIHPDDKAPERAAMQACLDGKNSLYTSEHRMQGEDGKWRWIATRGMVVARTEDGQPQRMIGTLTDITERRTTAERLNSLGRHDETTGLPNRTLFFGMLQQTMATAKRNKALLALLYVDIDRLKAVNDSFGRMVADKLLREVAEVLRKSVRDSDVVAHFGGDDFVILLPAISSENDLQIVTGKIREAMSRDFTINDRHINITVSIGAMIFPLHARTAESMVNNALRAVRAAKAAGRNAVHIGPVALDAIPGPEDQAARRAALQRRVASTN